jgi:hypothetical protein
MLANSVSKSVRLSLGVQIRTLRCFPSYADFSLLVVQVKNYMATCRHMRMEKVSPSFPTAWLIAFEPWPRGTVPTCMLQDCKSPINLIQLTAFDVNCVHFLHSYPHVLGDVLHGKLACRQTSLRRTKPLKSMPQHFKP